MSSIHHVTAISGNAPRNFDFYTRALGLRFVKKTVNFDDPGTYHFYYGDATGQPGTILTFFPWEQAAAGFNGTGQTKQTAFRVPARSLDYWIDRFVERKIAHGALEKRFGEPVLPFNDRDGMNLSLVGVTGAETETGWGGGGIPAEHAIRGLHGVTLMLEASERTGAILTDVFGFRDTAREGAIVRYFGDPGFGSHVDLHEANDFPAARQGRGSVHHVAFRARDDAEQAAMARKLVSSHGLDVTEQKDRNYFRSVYFREPGGVLFEIATDVPGFAIDEPVETLGQALKLPPFLESRRSHIEAMLLPLDGIA